MSPPSLTDKHLYLGMDSNKKHPFDSPTGEASILTEQVCLLFLKHGFNGRQVFRAKKKKQTMNTYLKIFPKE